MRGGVHVPVRMMAWGERRGFPGVKRSGTIPLDPSKLVVVLTFTKVRRTRRESPAFHTETFLRLVGGVYWPHKSRSRSTEIPLLYIVTAYGHLHFVPNYRGQSDHEREICRTVGSLVRSEYSGLRVIAPLEE